MGKIYYLNLKTLLETLAGQSGVLRRELPKGVGLAHEPSLCLVYIMQGKIAHCVLVGGNGQPLDASALLPHLYTLETWDVTLQYELPRPAAVTQPLPTAPRQAVTAPLKTPPTPSGVVARDTLVPYFVVQINVDLFANWSRKDRILMRTVIAQINGVRTIAEIRACLSLSPTVVDQALDMLLRARFIRLRRRGE